MANRLVNLCREQTQVIDTLIETYPTGLNLFENVLPPFDDSFSFLASSVRASAEEWGMTQALQRSYVAIFEQSRWLELLTLASQEEPVSAQPDRRLEWSVYLPSPSRAEVGILLPDDSGERRML